MTHRRGRGAERVRTRAKGQRKERRVTPAFNTYDFPIDTLAPDVAQAEDEVDETTPADPTRDEDLDEGEVDPYLDRFLGEAGLPPAPVGRRRGRRAYLAIADLNGEPVVLVQGIARPLTRQLWPGILEKAHTLKAIGEEIVRHYGEALLTPQRVGPSSRPLLKQSALVEALGGSNASTWKTRVSKIVRDEAIELPDGRTQPLHDFIARGAGRPAAAMEWEAAAKLLADHPEWALTELALRMVDVLGDRRLADPDPRVRRKVREKYRRRLGYIRQELRKELAARPGSSDRDVARGFVSARGLPASLEATVARIVRDMRRRAPGE